MSLNDLANMGQVIGAIAVVISLIYVALQIRQNTNAVRSATAQSVHEHFASWYHLIAADAELSRIVADGLRDYQYLFGAPGGKVFWKERGYMFGEEFRRCVEDDLMKRETHSEAKPLGAFSIGKPNA